MVSALGLAPASVYLNPPQNYSAYKLICPLLQFLWWLYIKSTWHFHFWEKKPNIKPNRRLKCAKIQNTCLIGAPPLLFTEGFTLSVVSNNFLKALLTSLLILITHLHAQQFTDSNPRRVSRAPIFYIIVKFPTAMLLTFVLRRLLLN